jgi:hypothetical protein
MTQYVINIGALPNDGTGDPLRTAFNDVNLNFDQVFAAGPVLSNIQIANNTIITTNTNGDLILATNGVGTIRAAANFLPDIGNVRYIGSPFQRFNTVYTRQLDALNATIYGNAAVTGNLSVTGNIVTNNYSNLDIANINITMGVGAPDPLSADGGGLILDGANATMLYNANLDAWTFNKPIYSTGTVSATYFEGDGSLLTNVIAVANAETLTGYYINSTVTDSSLTSVGELVGLSVVGNIIANEIQANFFGDGGNLYNINGSNITGNVALASLANLATLATTANLAIFANTAANANAAIFAVQAAHANLAQVANTVSTNAQPNITSVGTMTYLAVAGNIQTGNLLTNNYYYANGIAVDFSGTYSNANVIAYLPTNTANIQFSNLVLANAGANTTSIVRQNQLEPFGTEPFGIELFTQADDNPGVFSSIAAGTDYSALSSSNAGNAEVIVQGGYGISLQTSNITGGSLKTWSFVSTGEAYFPGNVHPTGIWTNNYRYANGVPVSFSGGGNSTPGGLDTQIQFNDLGTFGGDAGLTYNKTTDTLAAVNANVTGNLSANAFYIGNTVFTRTLTVGRVVTPVTVPLASNNSFNVLTGSGNVVVYTT